MFSKHKYECCTISMQVIGKAKPVYSQVVALETEQLHIIASLRYYRSAQVLLFIKILV